MSTIKFISELFRKYPYHLISLTLVAILNAVVQLVFVVSLTPVIESLIGKESEITGQLSSSVKSIVKLVGMPDTLSSFLILLLVLNFFRLFVEISLVRFIEIIRFKVNHDCLKQILKSFYNAKWYFFSSGKQGVFINTLITHVSRIGNAFVQIGNFSAFFVKMVVLMALPFYISWQVSLAIIFIACLIFAPLFMLGKYARKLAKNNLVLSNQFSVKIQESLAAAKIILGFGVQNNVLKSLTLMDRKIIRVGLKQMTLKQAITSATHPIAIVVVIIAFTLSRKFAVPVADAAVMLYAMMSVVPLIGGLTAQRHIIEEYVPSYQQYVDQIKKAEDLKQVSGSKKFNSLESGIEIDNISFAYPNNELTLTNISMLIPRGKMTAIVGESGTGKSTLIDVIMGFNEPNNGTINLDGTPLQDYDIQTFRNKIGYVPQESVLFNMSIADNLRWAKDDTTDEDIKAACQMAYADGFIESLPDKYDTLVGDRGVRLSGGQAQRVCLARAIIRYPELLFLDEATSALDTESEGMIQKAIDNLKGEITIVVIAHRLSTIRKADYVYVLEKGIVIEEGAYKDLTRKTGTRLRKMVTKQKL